MWKYYALLSAIFAALTAIFAKIGIKGINSNLATAIRTVIILAITWGIVIASNNLSQIKELSRTNWIFLILSGTATGLSWLFYFKALQLGDASKVAPHRQIKRSANNTSFFPDIKRACQRQSIGRRILNYNRSISYHLELTSKTHLL